VAKRRLGEEKDRQCWRSSPSRGYTPLFLPNGAEARRCTIERRVSMQMRESGPGPAALMARSRSPLQTDSSLTRRPTATECHRDSGGQRTGEDPQSKGPALANSHLRGHGPLDPPHPRPPSPFARNRGMSPFQPKLILASRFERESALSSASSSSMRFCL
jgi:hypothetical protein